MHDDRRHIVRKPESSRNMVSLANGNTDVLSSATTDMVQIEKNNIDSHKDNAILEQESAQRAWLDLVTKKHITDRCPLEVTSESSEMENSVASKSLVETIVATLDKSENTSETTDNGLYNCCSSDPPLCLSSVGNESLMNGKKSPAELETNTAVSSLSAPNIGNFVYVGSLKNIGKGDIKREVYLVNSSSLLKGHNTSEILTNDDGNALGTPIINDIINKTKAISSNSEGQALNSTKVSRSFVQLSQSNMKNITLNVTPTSTNSILLKRNQQSYEILRAKLMENRLENPEPTLLEIPTVPLKAKTVFKPAMSASQACVSKYANESSAVIEARNELIKCRKKLIEAAIFPKLATKVPLNGYVGPTFSCEECQDTFVSEDSLKNHKDRRSVLFTYNCPTCKQTLEFYNRCTLILHVRSHDSAIKACFLTISIIPSDKLKFSVLEDKEESETNDEDQILLQSRSNFVPNIHVAVTRKPVTKFVEKTAESSSVRIVKSFKKKKQPSAATKVEDCNDELFKDEMSPLKSLLVGERELSQTKLQKESLKSNNELPLTKSLASNDKKSSEGTTDDEIPPLKSPTQKTKKIPENNVKSKTLSKQSLSSTSTKQEVSNSSEVTASGVKRSEQKKTPAVSNNNIKEITLSGSDEEEDSLPNSDDKSGLVMCRDCKKDVPYLTQHYRGDNRPKKEYPCEECHYFNASACALSAHVRMHTKTQPFVCPDCGYFFSTLETFLLHVKQVCFYDFKAIRFKCPECSALKPSAPKFAEHLRRDHIREVFKCDACMTSAYLSTVVEAHIAKMHPNPSKPISVLEGYWCKLCPNMLVSKQLLDQHINKHVYSLQYLQYVYICKMCNNYATLRRSKFAYHYHTMCSQSIETTTLESEVKKPNRLRKRVGKKLIEALKETGKVNSNEAKRVAKKPPPIEHCATDNSKKDAERNGNLCIMCRQTKVSKSSSMFCHQCVRIVDTEDTSSVTETASRDGISRIKRKFKCKLCKEFTDRDWSTITKHFELCHHSDFDVRAKMRSSSSDLNSQSFAANRKRKALMKIQENTKILKLDSKYKCAKCSTVTNDRNQFHEHIVTHKAQSDFQCLECGLCFIVRASLEKHLIVEHKIRHGDLKEYFKANGMEVVEEKVEERTLNENQCEVCYLQCGSKQHYDKHIRTHGMAFVAMQSKAKI